MKKIFTLFFAAAASVSALADTTVVSVYGEKEFTKEDQEALGILPDPKGTYNAASCRPFCPTDEYFGKCETTYTYDAVNKRYNLTNFLGIEKGNFSIDVDESVTFPYCAEYQFAERYKVGVYTQYGGDNSPALDKRSSIAYVYPTGYVDNPPGVLSFYFDPDLMPSNSLRSGFFRSEPDCSDDIYEINPLKGAAEEWLFYQPRISCGGSDKRGDWFKTMRTYANIEGDKYKICMFIDNYGYRKRDAGSSIWNEFIGESGTHYFIFELPMPSAGVEGISADENAPVEYFNLQGMKVENPSAGLYIRRQGSKVEKVVLH